MTKRWQTHKGHFRGGQKFTKGSLYHLLTNPVCQGKIKYKKEVHPGEHPAIIPTEIWQQAQDLLGQQGPGTMVRTESHALLKGILRCKPCGFAMTPTFAARNGGKRYRLYTCVNALKRGRQACPHPYLPAHDVDKLVIEQIGKWAMNRRNSAEAKNALAPFLDISAWEELPPAEQARLVQHWVQRVEYSFFDECSGTDVPLRGRTSDQALAHAIASALSSQFPT